MAKSYAEQVADLKTTRDARVKELQSVAQKAADESRSMDDAERERFDTLEADIRALDGDIERMSRLAAIEEASVKPVVERGADRPARTISGVQLRHEEKTDPGIGLARYVRCILLAKSHPENPGQIAQALYPHDARLHQTLGVTKADKIPAASSDPTGPNYWAPQLITDGGTPFADFVEYLRPRTLVGQIEGRLRRLPFDTPVLVQTAGGSGYWTGEGASKKLTSWSYNRVKLEPLKVASIAVVTQELLRRATPAADMLIRDELARAIGATIDSTFIGSAAGTPGITPAGLLSGTTNITAMMSGSTNGTDAEDVLCDIKSFLQALSGADLSVAGSFWVMSEMAAITLSLLTNALGNLAFPGMTPTGGTLAGLPVFTSNHVAYTTHGATVALVRGDEVYFGDDGGLEVASSDQASILMDNDVTTHSSKTGTGADLVSMFQTNSLAIRAERTLNWQVRRATGVVHAATNWESCK